jgi:alkylation response protein AidB-like acyl-CoA dehydrogenase
VAGLGESPRRSGTERPTTTDNDRQRQGERRHGHRLHAESRAGRDSTAGARVRQRRVKPGEAELDKLRDEDRADYIGKLIALRKQAMEVGLWMPHMPKEWGGMGLGHVQLAMVQAEAAKASMGPWVLNCQAPDEGNMHTLLHWGTARAEGEVPQAAVRRHGDELLRDDRAGGRRQ